VASAAASHHDVLRLPLRRISTMTGWTTRSLSNTPQNLQLRTTKTPKVLCPHIVNMLCLMTYLAQINVVKFTFLQPYVIIIMQIVKNIVRLQIYRACAIGFIFCVYLLLLGLIAGTRAMNCLKGLLMHRNDQVC